MTLRADVAIAAPRPAARPRPPAGAAPAAPRAGAEERGRWLYSSMVDFLLLGGGSFLVLGALAAFWPRDDGARVALAGAMLLLAHVVNHPHFAHSYQIFYRGFARKSFPRSSQGEDGGTHAGCDVTRARDKAPLPPGEGFGVRAERGSAPEPAPASTPESSLAARYRFAGIMVPAVLAAFFATALAEGSVALLGLAANVMFFMVGWHYAKQGYGILMLDAARKGLRFAPDARQRLLWNTHLAWVANWLAVNDLLSVKELWGITYYLIDVPDPLLFGVIALAAVSTLAVARDLFALWRAERALPVNGLLAYVAAVYVWLALSRLDPILLLVVPFFHSLQYLAVVWRYQLSVEETARRSSAPAAALVGTRWKTWLRSAPAGLARFILVGGALGFAGFWLAPITVDALSGYDQAVFGTTLFLFIGWTFVNIHHYFIDNVIWRRENPEARQHVFGGGTR